MRLGPRRGFVCECRVRPATQDFPIAIFFFLVFLVLRLGNFRVRWGKEDPNSPKPSLLVCLSICFFKRFGGEAALYKLLGHIRS